MELAVSSGAAGGLAPGDGLGPYRLVRKVGEGGMGEVWLAEQTEPIERRVALKIVKHGIDSEETIRRFESEGQALARMDHPAIASIFDAGLTPGGRPYFVMEYIDGEPITRYCEGHDLTTRDRLKLFQRVCEGVQHAHRCALIHRDLKPSNVMVTEVDGRPVPKIIDFGLAKVLRTEDATRSAFTEHGLLLGTPEYMSPEQTSGSGDDVDTRTDVYALGVLLYELLIGALPFDAEHLRRAGYEALLRAIREDDPPLPSQRISAVSTADKSEGRQGREHSSLARELKGDLDWITLKALEKDRARRYESPADLAGDIERHLNHQPVIAGPPSAAYRMKKFVRRHWIAVGATAVVLVALLAGLAGTAYGLVRAREAEGEARAEAETSERALGFMVDLFQVSNPSESRGNTITAREVLDRGVEQIEEGLSGEPEIQARLMETMAKVHMSLGLYERAEELLKGALEREGAVLGPNHPQMIDLRDQYARVRTLEGHVDEGLRLHREVFEQRRALLGPRHPDTLITQARLGSAYMNAGNYEQAASVLRETADLQREVLGPHHEDTLDTLLALIATLGALDRTDEAVPLAQEVYAGHLELFGEDHPATLNAMHDLAMALGRAGRREEALAISEKLLEASKRVIGEDHPNTLMSAFNHGSWLATAGRTEEAAELLSDTLERQRRALGETHRNTLLTMTKLGNLLGELGDYERAEALLRAAVDGYSQTLGDGHPYTFIAMTNLGTFFAERGRYEEAIETLERACDGFDSTLGPDHHVSLRCRTYLADAWRRSGQPDRALIMLEQTLAHAREVLGDDHEQVGRTLATIGSCFVDQEKWTEAEPVLADAVDRMTASFGPDSRLVRLAAEQLATTRQALGSRP
jgi:non-specific serine/threonine protein kinase/serine/threonine-protein kinase